MYKLKSEYCGQKKNKGFTLVEMVITVAIFAILLGMITPSLNSVLGFRVQRATNSIASALDKTRREAMSRLVGEMKLEYRSDGYYITYYLDRGKEGAESSRIRNDDSEKSHLRERESVIRTVQDRHIICGRVTEILLSLLITVQLVVFFLSSQMNGSRIRFWQYLVVGRIFRWKEMKVYRIARQSQSEAGCAPV